MFLNFQRQFIDHFHSILMFKIVYFPCTSMDRKYLIHLYLEGVTRQGLSFVWRRTPMRLPSPGQQQQKKQCQLSMNFHISISLASRRSLDDQECTKASVVVQRGHRCSEGEASRQKQEEVEKGGEAEAIEQGWMERRTCGERKVSQGSAKKTGFQEHVMWASL